MTQNPYAFAYVVYVSFSVLRICFASEIDFTFFSRIFSKSVYYAPINVKPAGGGGRQGMGWRFDIFQKFAFKFPAHGKIIPVKRNQIPPPQAAHVKHLKGVPKKGTIKRSLNKTLQPLFINVAASPKIHVPVTSAIICFNQSINPCHTA